MKIIFLGATKFSEDVLTHLLNNNITVDHVFTIPKEFGISYSEQAVINYNFSDLKQLTEKYNIPCDVIDSGKGIKIADYIDVIKQIRPDVILVMGWYYMVPKVIREAPRLGTWGIHASLLPNYAGGAPLVWAIIEGQKETGVTLFRLGGGVDDGDIIRQERIKIEENDSIYEVYNKATEVSKRILVEVLRDSNNIRFEPQAKSMIKVYPQRKPDDGELDLTLPAKQMYDFIRAQSTPYPGAFIRTIDGKKIVIEKAKILD